MELTNCLRRLESGDPCPNKALPGRLYCSQHDSIRNSNEIGAAERKNSTHGSSGVSHALYQVDHNSRGRK